MPRDANGLTPKQSAFVRHYVSEDCFANATESARRAGYKGNDATLGQVGAENLKKPAIADAIAKAMDDSNAGGTPTIESVLKDVRRRGRKAEQAGQHNAALKASELEGKFLAMWTERIEHVRSLGDVSTDELLSVVEELVQKADSDVSAGLLSRFKRAQAGDGPLPLPEGTPSTH